MICREQYRDLITRYNVEAAGKRYREEFYSTVETDDVVTHDRPDLMAMSGNTEPPASLGDDASGCVPRRRPPGEALGAPDEDLRAEGRAICCRARGSLSAKYSAWTRHGGGGGEPLSDRTRT